MDQSKRQANPSDVTSTGAVAEDTRQSADTLGLLLQDAAMTRHIHAAVAVRSHGCLSLSTVVVVVVAVAVVEEDNRAVGYVLGEDSLVEELQEVVHIHQVQTDRDQVVVDYIRHKIPAAAVVGQDDERPSHPWCRKRSRWHRA